MKQDSKQQMIEGALTLLAKQGLQATSFGEVLKLTNAPRGSIYHHFPGGKDELVAEALKLQQERTAASLRALDSSKPELIVEGFFELWRYLLTTYDFSVGCSAVAVAVATSSPELLQRTEGIFSTWQDILTEKFRAAGLTTPQATGFATTVIASSEGAVVMARAAKDLAPFERVAKQLAAQAKAMRSVS